MAEKEAKTETSDSDFKECSLCFENDDLKRLPCNPAHIYCVTCLTKDSETTEIIKCPLCRTVFDEGIDDIPSAGAPLDKFLCCDVCMRKDDKRRLAQIYCVICQKKFCTPHEKSHNDALDDHRRIRMDEYKRDHRKMETRYCEKHTKQVYMMTCEQCNKMFCAECMEQPNQCNDGKNHKLLTTANLVAKLTDMVNEKKVWIFDKEEHLLGTSKQLTAVISDWDSETQQMIEKLHRARDEQIALLARKYAELEEQLVEMRKKSKTEVTCFLDDEIGTRLDQLSRQVARIDCRLHTYHEVDVAGGFKETERLINELMKMEIPSYKPSSNHVQLTDKDCGDLIISVEITQSESVLTIQPSDTLVNPPTSLTLVRTVKLSSQPHSVTKHGDRTLAGLENHQLVQIYDQTNKKSVLATVPGYVSSIQVYGSEIYILSSQSNMVYVYDLAGKLLRSWVHKSSSVFNKLGVVDDKVIIPCAQTNSLSEYSVHGTLVKQIPCPGVLRDPSYRALAINEYDSVIVTDVTAGVSRVSIRSGEVMWTSKYVPGPQGVVCYKNRYLLVSNSDANIWILDVDTGEFVGELMLSGNEKIRLDLEIDDNCLMVANYKNRTIQYYNLLTD